MSCKACGGPLVEGSQFYCARCREEVERAEKEGYYREYMEETRRRMALSGAMISRRRRRVGREAEGLGFVFRKLVDKFWGEVEQE